MGKAFVMGLIVTCAFGLWMTAMEGFLGIDYQVWNLSTYLKPSPERIVKAIPYMLIIFTVMGLGNVNQRVLPSTGNERKDMWIAVAVNTIFTASALFFRSDWPGSLCRGRRQHGCIGFCIWLLLHDGWYHGCRDIPVPQIWQCDCRCDPMCDVCRPVYASRLHSGTVIM